jgi:hypothetical protein
MTGWQPDLDLQRLLAALGEELRAASDEEVRQAYGVAPRSVAAAARDIRKRIAAASGGQDEPDSGPLAGEIARRLESCFRGH